MAATPEDTRTADAARHPGLVVTAYSGCCDVLIDGEVRLCNLVGEIAKTQKTSLAVGDRVRVQDTGDTRWLVTHVEPRTTLLSRPDPSRADIERVIAANVDIVGIVIAARNPTPRPGIIDRLWVATQRGGAEAFVIVNKMDLTNARYREQLDILLHDYRELGLGVYCVSSQTGEGIEELRAAIRGKTITFAGHSGVGKSSLLNALAPEFQAKTGDVRDRDGKGRHTTSASTLYQLSDGTTIIDTPGVRAFGLMDVGPDSLRFYFPDIHEVAQRCHFSDCRHVDEPGCAVLEAFDTGELSELRYAAWLRLLSSEVDIRIPRRGHNG